jgi:hypothetical protein
MEMRGMTMDEEGRKADITIRLSEFDLPPMQDILLIGRDAPIGPEAAKRMVDAVAPEQYELLRLENGNVEAVVVRRRLLNMLPKERLLPLVLDEVERFAPANMVIKGQVTVNIVINRLVTL